MPERIQLRRTKGWRKPAGAIVVARPTRWGNPWAIDEPHPATGVPMTRTTTVGIFRTWVETSRSRRAAIRRDLAGHDLACWCPLDSSCHADVLLEIANRPDGDGSAA